MKITTQNKSEAVAQTDPGIPDDRGRSLDMDADEAAEIENYVREPRDKQQNPEPPYDVSRARGGAASASSAGKAPPTPQTPATQGEQNG